MKLQKHIINSGRFPPVTHYGKQSEADRIQARLATDTEPKLTDWHRSKEGKPQFKRPTDEQYSFVWEMYHQLRITMKRKAYICEIANKVKLPISRVEKMIGEMRIKNQDNHYYQGYRSIGPKEK